MMENNTHIYSLYKISDDNFLLKDVRRDTFHQFRHYKEIIDHQDGSRFNLPEQVQVDPKNASCINIFERIYTSANERDSISGSNYVWAVSDNPPFLDEFILLNDKLLNFIWARMSW